MKVKRPKSAAPVLSTGGKREKAFQVPFRRTTENALAFRPRSANSPERVHGQLAIAAPPAQQNQEEQQQHPLGSSYIQGPHQQALGSTRHRARSFDVGTRGYPISKDKMGGAPFNIEGHSDECPRPKTANVTSPTARGSDGGNLRLRPSTANAMVKGHMGNSRPSRPPSSWRRAYSPNQSRFIRPSSGSQSRPRSTSRTTKGMARHGGLQEDPPVQAAHQIGNRQPFGEAGRRADQLAASARDNVGGAVPVGPIGIAGHETGIPPWLAEAKQFFQRRYLEASMKATSQNSYGQGDRGRVDNATFENWGLQAQRLVQEAELLWRGNVHLAKELDKENVARVARVSREKSVEQDLREELNRIKAEVIVTQGSLDQMRDLATKAATKEAKATKKMEKTRAVHDRLLRRLMYSGLDLEKVLGMDADGKPTAPDVGPPGNGQKPGRGPGGYLTSAKAKAANNIVRRENQKLKRENKQVRQELKMADMKVKRLWTRLHRVEGGSMKGVSLAPEGAMAMRGNESVGDGYSEDNPSLSGPGWHKPVRSRGESEPSYALMAGMHTNLNNRPFSRHVQAPLLEQVGNDGSIIPGAGSWNGQEFDISKGNEEGTYDEDEYEDEYGDDFEDLNAVGDIGNNGIAGDNLFNSNSVHGIIERFLETAGLAAFADAIMFRLGKDFTCLNDLFNPDNLSDEELMGAVVDMNQEQVQSFRENVESFDFEELDQNQQQLPFRLESDTVEGGSANIASAEAIGRFLYERGLLDFASALIQEPPRGLGCRLEDLNDAKFLSDEKLSNIGMNNIQIRTFREAVVQQVEGSAGRSTLPDDDDDDDDDYDGSCGGDENEEVRDVKLQSRSITQEAVVSAATAIQQVATPPVGGVGGNEGSRKNNSKIVTASRNEELELLKLRVAELESALSQKQETIEALRISRMAESSADETTQVSVPMESDAAPLADHHGFLGLSHLFIRRVLKEATKSKGLDLLSVPAPIVAPAKEEQGNEVPPSIISDDDLQRIGSVSLSFVSTVLSNVEPPQSSRPVVGDQVESVKEASQQPAHADAAASASLTPAVLAAPAAEQPSPSNDPTPAPHTDTQTESTEFPVSSASGAKDSNNDGNNGSNGSWQPGEDEYYSDGDFTEESKENADEDEAKQA